MFAGEMLKGDSLSLRRKVAREAASLLYFGVEKEYKQAKLKAAKTFRVHCLPTNFDVAVELDKLADENEGSARQERLIMMRKEALKLMKILKAYNPVLVGSVWRGTICRGSDIDIIVHNDEPEEVLNKLKQNGLSAERSEWVNVTKRGKKRAFFHVHLDLPAKEKAEIVVHSSEEACLKEKCEIYGDSITGMRLHELQKILKDDPGKRFVPS